MNETKAKEKNGPNRWQAARTTEHLPGANDMQVRRLRRVLRHALWFSRHRREGKRGSDLAARARPPATETPE